MSVSISNTSSNHSLEAVKVLPFKDPRKAAFPNLLDGAPSQLRDATIALALLKYVKDGKQNIEDWISDGLAPEGALPERYSLKDGVENLLKKITDRLSKTEGPEYKNLIILQDHLDKLSKLLQILWDNQHTSQTA